MWSPNLSSFPGTTHKTQSMQNCARKLTSQGLNRPPCGSGIAKEGSGYCSPRHHSCRGSNQLRLANCLHGCPLLPPFKKTGEVGSCSTALRVVASGAGNMPPPHPPMAEWQGDSAHLRGCLPTCPQQHTAPNGAIFRGEGLWDLILILPSQSFSGHRAAACWFCF